MILREIEYLNIALMIASSWICLGPQLCQDGSRCGSWLSRGVLRKTVIPSSFGLLSYFIIDITY